MKSFPLLLLLLTVLPALAADWVWVEGESPARASVNRHPWYDQAKKDQFSDGDFISHFSNDNAGEAEYRFTAPAGGDYHFWVRANPVQSKMSYRLNDGAWAEINLERNEESVNVAFDGKPDLRFIAWILVGRVSLPDGPNTIRFRMDSRNSHHGYLDCFVFSRQPFQPMGLFKPDQIAAARKAEDRDHEGWFAFDPGTDNYSAGSAIDLRWLNEKVAGENGFIKVKNGHFVYPHNGEPVRFWAVNGPSSSAKTRSDLSREARLLARYGVNLVRIHGRVFNRDGEPDLDRVHHIIDIVETMKAEGIYTHLSIYFPLWMTPAPGTPWLEGYDGNQHPFAALYFNPDFQEKYRDWWRALLLTPSHATGRKLVEEPSLFGAEIVNEDSYFFWTFSERNLPDPQLRLLETQFGDWLIKKYGSLDAALKEWKSQKLPRDDFADGRAALRPLYNIFNDKTTRDQDTAAFLLESQTAFYRDTYAFLRSLGFEGLITPSNWTTANAEVLGPLDKLSYTVGDFVDRHGYFSCLHKGDNAAWSIRDGHTYADRSAYRFEPNEPGQPKQFVHPSMEVKYNNLPSMISETTWNRPNRYRSEAPLYLATFGALQDTDAIVHFAYDGSGWNVKPGFWMQPWTLMSPAMVGQFPAAALIYRRGFVPAGAVLADIRLNIEDLKSLQGTPLPQGAAFDELRLKDVPDGTQVKPGQVIDPLIHFAGQTRVRFTKEPGAVNLEDLSKWIDREKQIVQASHGQLTLNYGDGVLIIDAPSAQGVSGHLEGSFALRDLTISSGMDLGHVILVALDDRPLAASRRMLLQVMSEEKTTGFETEPVGGNTKRITDIGRDPWRVKEFAGRVEFSREVSVQPLDLNGRPDGRSVATRSFELQPTTVYYLVKAL